MIGALLIFLLHNLGQIHFITYDFIVDFNFCNRDNCMQSASISGSYVFDVKTYRT